jgi:hypothetical protein
VALNQQMYIHFRMVWHLRLITLLIYVIRLSRQYRTLNISQPYRPTWPVTGIALLYRVFFWHKRIKLAVKKIEIVSDRMSYLVLRGCWCDTIVPKVRVAVDVNDSLYEQLECVFNKFPNYHVKILLANINHKVGK